MHDPVHDWKHPALTPAASSGANTFTTTGRANDGPVGDEDPRHPPAAKLRLDGVGVPVAQLELVAEFRHGLAASYRHKVAVIESRVLT